MDAVIEIGMIDDNQMFREMMQTWLTANGDDVRLTVATASVEEFLAVAPLPGIVLLDLNLENHTYPADNVAQLVAAGLKVIMVSVIPDPEYIWSTTEAGAVTYVLKTSRLDHLIRMIRAVHEGEDVITQEHAFNLIHDNRKDRPVLSERERKVLIAYGTGDTMDAIARRLGITKSTVQTYLQRVKAKYVEVGRPIRHRGDYSDRIREDRLGREGLGGSGEAGGPGRSPSS